MSTVYGFFQESDVVSIVLFFVAPFQSLSRKTGMREISGPGRTPACTGAEQACLHNRQCFDTSS